MKRIGGAAALAVIGLAVGCSSSPGIAKAGPSAPVSARPTMPSGGYVVPIPSSAFDTDTLDANARIACSHYDDAVTHDSAANKAVGSYIITGTGSDGVADGAAAIEAWQLGVVAGSKSATTAILTIADAQLLKDPSGDPTTFTAALLAMRDACIGAGWMSTSTP